MVSGAPAVPFWALEPQRTCPVPWVAPGHATAEAGAGPIVVPRGPVSPRTPLTGVACPSTGHFGQTPSVEPIADAMGTSGIQAPASGSPVLGRIQCQGFDRLGPNRKVARVIMISAPRPFVWLTPVDSPADRTDTASKVRPLAWRPYLSGRGIRPMPGTGEGDLGAQVQAPAQPSAMLRSRPTRLDLSRQGGTRSTSWAGGHAARREIDLPSRHARA